MIYHYRLSITLQIMWTTHHLVSRSKHKLSKWKEGKHDRASETGAWREFFCYYSIDFVGLLSFNTLNLIFYVIVFISWFIPQNSTLTFLIIFFFISHHGPYCISLFSSLLASHRRLDSSLFSHKASHRRHKKHRNSTSSLLDGDHVARYHPCYGQNHRQETATLLIILHSCAFGWIICVSVIYTSNLARATCEQSMFYIFQSVHIGTTKYIDTYRSDTIIW
jgi:hypothetical protein